MKINQHGGNRPGSGAKLKGSTKRVTRSINLEPSTWRRLDVIAAHHKVSASEIVHRWVKRAKLKAGACEDFKD